MQLNTARVFVRDLRAAQAFYGQALALRLKADGGPAGYCVFQSGAAELVVEAVADDAPEEEQRLVGRFTGLSFTVHDIHSTCERLRAHGVDFTGEPERQPWGGTLATFRDPAGNQLQLVQPPAA